MTGLSLEAISSYVRDLSSSCSAVRLIGDSLFAGSHDGSLVSWDSSSGVENWRISIAGPISDISLDSDIIYVTASDSLHAVDQEEGSLLWSKQLILLSESSVNLIVAYRDSPSLVANMRSVL